MPAIRPLAIDGAAPRTMTNKMAEVEIPNKMMANGNQAIDGIVCNPVISDPTAARNGRILETRAPTTAPMSTARRTHDRNARVVPIACHSPLVCI